MQSTGGDGITLMGDGTAASADGGVVAAVVAPPGSGSIEEQESQWQLEPPSAQQVHASFPLSDQTNERPQRSWLRAAAAQARALG